MKKLLMSSVVAATMLSTAGVAKIATDGTGQFLIAPTFYAADGFETKLKIVNTSLNKSYLYRVTVRESESSEEFDFIIGLSPSDVWDATIYEGANGNTYIKSDDDSNFAPITNGYDITNHFNSNRGGRSTRSFDKGYVEFYPIAMYRETAEGTISAKVSKSTLETRFTTLQANLTDAIADIDDTGLGGPRYVERNGSIAGFVSLVNENWKAQMTIPMKAFENVINTSDTGLDGEVPSGSNIAYGVDAVPSFYLGNGLGDGSTLGVQNVARDLDISGTTMPFESNGNNDMLWFTFWNDHSGESRAEGSCLQSRRYSIAARDMEEGRGTDVVDYFSPLTNPTNTIPCEVASVEVSNLLTQANFADTEKGAVILSGLTNVSPTSQTQYTNNVPSAIVTGMSAVVVNGSPSFSWVYAPTVAAPYER